LTNGAVELASFYPLSYLIPTNVLQDQVYRPYFPGERLNSRMLRDIFLVMKKKTVAESGLDPRLSTLSFYFHPNSTPAKKTAVSEPIASSLVLPPLCGRHLEGWNGRQGRETNCWLVFAAH
jgi:hypothetical protein